MRLRWMEDIAMHLKTFFNRDRRFFLHFHVGLEMKKMRTAEDTPEAQDEADIEIERDMENDRLIDEAIRQQEEDEYYRQISESLAIDRMIDMMKPLRNKRKIRYTHN
eukprot:66499_1